MKLTIIMEHIENVSKLMSGSSYCWESASSTILRNTNRWAVRAHDTSESYANSVISEINTPVCVVVELE